MADITYNVALKNMLQWIDDATIKAALLMSNTTADTERTVATIGGFTTHGQCDDSNYTDKTLSTILTQDDTDDRGVITHSSSSLTWSGNAGDGSLQMKALLVYKDVGGVFADGIPIWLLLFPENRAMGTDPFVVNFSSDGVGFSSDKTSG